MEENIWRRKKTQPVREKKNGEGKGEKYLEKEKWWRTNKQIEIGTKLVPSEATKFQVLLVSWHHHQLCSKSEMNWKLKLKNCHDCFSGAHGEAENTLLKSHPLSFSPSPNLTTFKDVFAWRCTMTSIVPYFELKQTVCLYNWQRLSSFLVVSNPQKS